MDRFRVSRAQAFWPGECFYCQNPAALLAYCLAFVFCLYTLRQYLDIDLLAFVLDLLWDCLVFVTPPSFILAFEGPPSMNPRSPKTYAELRTFATKREALARIAGRKNFMDHPAGLKNSSYSCFQNSILQSLASLKPLRYFLRFAELNVPGHSHRPTNKTLLVLLQQLNNPACRGRTLQSSASLQALAANEQQDASEYYSLLTGIIEDEITKDVEAQNLPKPFGVHGTGLHKMKQPANTNQGLEPSAEETQIEDGPGLRNPLECLTAQLLCCKKCGFNEGLSLTPCKSLVLNIPGTGPTTIEECLNDFTKVEVVESRCPKCTLEQCKDVILQQLNGEMQKHSRLERTLKNVDAVLQEQDFSDYTLAKKLKIKSEEFIDVEKAKQVVIARCPDILILQLNRSIYGSMMGGPRKNARAVSFPKHLNMAPWSLNGVKESTPGGWTGRPGESILAADQRKDMDTITAETPLYVLRSIVIHHGSHDRGHYIAFKQDEYDELAEEDKTEAKARKWWRLSDESVAEVSEVDVLSQSAAVFMMFYEQLRGDELDEYLQPFGVRMSRVGMGLELLPAPSPTSTSSIDQRVLEQILLGTPGASLSPLTGTDPQPGSIPPDISPPSFASQRTTSRSPLVTSSTHSWHSPMQPGTSPAGLIPERTTSLSPSASASPSSRPRPKRVLDETDPPPQNGWSTTPPESSEPRSTSPKRSKNNQGNAVPKETTPAPGPQETSPSSNPPSPKPGVQDRSADLLSVSTSPPMLEDGGSTLKSSGASSIAQLGLQRLTEPPTKTPEKAAPVTPQTPAANTTKDPSPMSPDSPSLVNTETTALKTLRGPDPHTPVRQIHKTPELNQASRGSTLSSPFVPPRAASLSSVKTLSTDPKWVKRRRTPSPVRSAKAALPGEVRHRPARPD